MHVLIVSQYFFPENFGINEIAYDLVDLGHRVTVLTGMPNYPSGRIQAGYGGLRLRREIIRGVSVVRVPILPRGQNSFVSLAVNYLSFAMMGSLLAPFAVRESPDVMLVYEPSPLTVALPALTLRFFRRIPIVLWIQDLWPESLIAVKAVTSAAPVAAIRRLSLFIYRRCRIILVQSLAYIPRLQVLGLKDADIRYMPNSAPSHFRPLVPPPDAPERQLFADGFNVVFAGNIGSQQDPETMLAAAEVLKNIADLHLVIIGEGSSRDWVATEIVKRQLAGTCRLLDWQPSERMPTLFALADALLITLLPSSISGLTVPSKLQSYLACGRPIVGAVDGETRRMINESGAGFACASGDPQALAQAIQTVYKASPQQRKAMGDAARAYFEQHFEREALLRSLTTCLIEASKTGSSFDSPATNERISAE
jgi:glycosyltransferase involved in cell wall biosynthesis